MSSPHQSAYLAAVAQRVLVLDGAMGTNVMAYNLPLSDYDQHENCTDILVATRPDVIGDIHRKFLAAGCDGVETNSFGTNKVVLAEFGLADRTYELNVQAAQIARAACDAFATRERPRFVVGSMGPGTKLATLRQATFEVLVDSYAEQVRGLIDGGVDALLIETCQDVLQIKAAINAVLVARQQRRREDLPIMVQVTMDLGGTMLVGTDLPAALTTIEAYPEVDSIGMNCATGPDAMAEHIRYLGQNSTRYLSCLPNAGLPQMVDGKPHYALTPAELARWLTEFVTHDGVNIVGGCCGTTYPHLEAVVKACAGLAPRPRALLGRDPAKPIGPNAAGGEAPVARVSSLYQAVELRQDNSFLIIGERCNTNGSRKFKRLLLEQNWEEIVDVAREQVSEGSHVLDVCVDYVGRDGVPDMREVADRLSTQVHVPLMLDSTQVDVLEAGLKLCPGKCIINSMNLEDGEEKLARICRLARTYGAAVVALTIDEDPVEAMGKTAARKLAIARRIYDLAVNKYGLRPSDILWDCLTFPITTGNEADRRLGLETLDGIEAIMKAFPSCQSVLGLSNISFGLKAEGRRVLNSVYLHHARQRGLTAAIVHVSGLIPLDKIEDEARLVAEDLIYDRRGAAGASRAARAQGAEYDPLLVMSQMFSEATAAVETTGSALPVEERLKKRIIDGNKVGLEKDLDECRTGGVKPLDIINNYLLEGMKVVGELFGAGKMQLPFVLKSAETMKTAVAHLEPHMEKVQGSGKGKIVLATVKGDVHDIGKNLVDIILTNNGYTVYNIGIKQPLNSILEKWKETGADAIGMSGLLVKSTIIMKENLEELNLLKFSPPVLLGGAALTRSYVEKDLRKVYAGQVFYCKDAFEGLAVMDQVMTGGSAAAPAAGDAGAALAAASAAVERAGPSASQRAVISLIADEDTTDEQLEAAVAADAQEAPAAATPAAPAGKSSDIRRDVPVPVPPFWGARVVADLPLKSVLTMMNEVMLFQVQWQHKKAGRPTPEFKKYLDQQVRPIYRKLVEQCGKEKILTPRAVYGYWPCHAEGDDLVLFDPAPLAAQGEGEGPIRLAAGERRAIARFTFPRQRKAPWWCLSDFFRPADSGELDVVAFQAVTVGQQASDVARQWFAANRYEDYLYLHGLSVEAAEAAAEFIHRQVRMELGIATRDARRLQDLFKQGYQGSRYSFGYPACPRLEDQALLLPLLGAERIGITLSDEFQLEPEQSTTALVCHHPQARYFNVR